MNLSSNETDGTRVITVNESRIDAAVAILFKDAMRERSIDAPARMVLDLSNVDFIDSSGLGSIVAAMKQLGRERQLDLAGLTPNVDKVFRLTRMDTVFTIYKTLEQALTRHVS